jgi:hypothetical protein
MFIAAALIDSVVVFRNNYAYADEKTRNMLAQISL